MPGDALACRRLLTSPAALTEENATLKRLSVEHARLAASAAAQQKRALRALLDVRQLHHCRQSGRGALHGARSVRAEALRRQGSDADIQPGEAVIDGEGVAGQAMRVYAYMPEVTLVTDGDHAVPVQV